MWDPEVILEIDPDYDVEVSQAQSAPSWASSGGDSGILSYRTASSSLVEIDYAEQVSAFQTKVVMSPSLACVVEVEAVAVTVGSDATA